MVINMKLVLSDVERELLHIKGDNQVIKTNDEMHNCIGCFGCWIKTPGRCVIRDELDDMGKNLSRCTELVIVSRCVYGSTSPPVKLIMDRAISYIHPNFCIRNGEMHHKRRYENKITINAYFYGNDISEAEKLTAQKLMKANAVNYDGNVGQVVFLQDKNEFRGMKI